MSGDALFADVSLLAQDDGGGGGFEEHSPNNTALTYEGSPSLSGGNLHLDGSAAAMVAASCMFLGTNSFTIECAVNINVASLSGTKVLWTNNATDTAHTVSLYAEGGALKMRTGSTVTTVVASPDAGAFHEYVYVRDNSTNTGHFFVDGTLELSWTDATDYGFSFVDLVVGRAAAGGSYFTGVVALVRVTIDARFTATYTVGTIPRPEFYKTIGGTVTGVADGEVTSPNGVQFIVFKASDFSTVLGTGNSNNTTGAWTFNVMDNTEHVVLFLDKRDQYSGGPDWYNHRVLRIMPDGGAPS